MGGGTKNFYGGPLQGEEVDMRQWAGIVEYEPTELVITVKPGTLLAEVEAALAAQKQELAFEPPRLGTGGTVGGAIASGLAGPARLSRGGVKDYVLGCTLLDGKGQLLHFGGVVMKNVAGYDVARVIPGSMGTLGIATELSIKVMPVAPAEATLQFEMDVNKAISQSNEWLSKPLPISATFFENGKLTVRLRGASAAVQAALKTWVGMKWKRSKQQPSGPVCVTSNMNSLRAKAICGVWQCHPLPWIWPCTVKVSMNGAAVCAGSEQTRAPLRIRFGQWQSALVAMPPCTALPTPPHVSMHFSNRMRSCSNCSAA